jgi:hypothetical protein
MKSKRCVVPPRLAYLVRCWPVQTEEGPVWRATVEDPHSVERYSFANLNALFAFLRERTETCLAQYAAQASAREQPK